MGIEGIGGSLASAYIVFKTNEGEWRMDGRTLRAAGAGAGVAVRLVECPPAVDRIGTPTATTFPPSSSAAALTTLCLMVMGAGRGGGRTDGRRTRARPTCRCRRRLWLFERPPSTSNGQILG